MPKHGKRIQVHSTVGSFTAPTFARNLGSFSLRYKQVVSNQCCCVSIVFVEGTHTFANGQINNIITIMIILL
jgi:hypothetical protein